MFLSSINPTFHEPLASLKVWLYDKAKWTLTQLNRYRIQFVHLLCYTVIFFVSKIPQIIKCAISSTSDGSQRAPTITILAVFLSSLRSFVPQGAVVPWLGKCSVHLRNRGLHSCLNTCQVQRPPVRLETKIGPLPLQYADSSHNLYMVLYMVPRCG